MTSYLIDLNVWLILSLEAHPFYARASEWIHALPKNRTRLLFCRITQLGLLRLLTNESVMANNVLTTAGALRILDRWNEDPRVEFAAEPKGIESAFRQSLEEFANKSATKVIMDAYLVGFASVEKATLVTFDKGLCKLAAQSKTAHLLLSSR